jgi:excisionase family DNA binding protein
MQLLSLKQAAERTGSSESFWRKQIWKQTIPVHYVGRLVRLSEDDLAAWLAQRRREGTIKTK